MKKIFYLFLIVKIGFLSAQIDSKNLYQDWYAVKIEMKDGSKPFLKKPTYLLNYGFRIDKDSYRFDEINKLQQKQSSPIPYVLRNDEMQTSPESALVIEKLNKDSLILSQSIKNIAENDLTRYYLVSLKKLKQERLAQFKGKDTLISNPILNPPFKNNLSKKDIKSAKMVSLPENKRKNFRLNGFILLDVKNRKAEGFLEDFNPEFKVENKNVLSNLTGNFNDWDVSQFRDFKFIKVPFSYLQFYQIEKTLISFGEIYSLNIADYDLVPSNKITLGSPNVESADYFEAAVKAYKKNKLKDAARLFEKSFKSNERNLNAYYNFAEISFRLRNIEKACEIYQFLIDEGQKPAVKEFNQKCVK